MKDEWNADAVLLRINNSFDNNDCSDVETISGFSGSNGTALVSADNAILSVDGRYTVQASRQTDPSIWKVFRYPDYNITKMIEEVMKAGETLVISGLSHSYNSYLSILKCTKSIGASVKVIDKYPLPRKQVENSLSLDKDYSAKEVRAIKDKLSDEEGVLITDKETVSCLFGIRKKILGEDKGPVPRMISFITKSSEPLIFCDLKPEFKEHKVLPIESFADEMKRFNGYNIKADYASCPAHFINVLNDLECEVINSIPDYDKIKTPKEMEDQKIGAHKTSLSFIKLLAHVDHTVSNGGKLTEAEAVSLFKHDEAIDFAFIPICASSENTALVHHQSHSDKIIDNEALFLFDAGFHFENSTTDMTRALYIGDTPDPLFKKVYTVVLKSVIFYSMTRFPKRTKACYLDAICRYHMWQHSMDYYFGTGHGVGNYRSVHQKPAISAGSTDKITGNMITTVEPGYYTEEFGIRLENMLASKEEPDEYVSFETITYIPFCYKLIDFNMFDQTEITWLNNYNRSIREKYASVLENSDNISYKWMLENTEPIQHA